MSKIRPVNGRVLCRPPQEEEKTVGGIYMPQNMRSDEKEKPQVGIIVAVDTSEEHPLNKQLIPGTKVLFNRFAALEIQRATEGNKKYYIMIKDNILGIYEDGEYEEVCPAGESL